MPEHTAMQWLPDALRGAGINVVELDGWEEAQEAYFWTDIDSGAQSYTMEPTCYMIHHTASTSANPSVRDSSGTWSKANCWAGLWRNGKLYQSGGGVPTVVFTAAGPARTSSGYGHGPTLHEIADDIRVPWDQQHPDTDMAANRYAWNVETVAAGDGSPIDPGVEHALVVMGALICDRFGWAPWRTVGHLTWSQRKIDPFWDGRRDVIVRIQNSVETYMEHNMVTHFHIGQEYAEYEPVTWLLFQLAGGDVDPNENSSQIEPFLGKTNARLVTADDFARIAQYTGMTTATLDRMKTDGLYRYGKEIAALNVYAYTG